MKITCQSCQSKYNVADEKVAGKVVKIRCRKCGATIVVNGAAAAIPNESHEATDAPPPASTQAVSADPWHVNLAENDQRTMGLSQLVEAYNSGVVTQDTFVWTEGMSDWMPLGEVEAVLTALHQRASHGSNESNASSGVDAAEAPQVAREVLSRAFASSAAPAYEAPAAFVASGASAAAPESGPRAEPRRAAVKREGRGRDLFATGLDHSQSAQDMQGSVQTSAPPMQPLMKPLAHEEDLRPSDDPNKLTGERNENSVLFSLAVLTRTAEERAPAFTDAPASSQDSGLIDLKALAAKTESLRPATMADGSIFSAPLGAMPPMSAPLGMIESPLGETQSKSKLPTIIGLVAGVALLLVLGIVIGVKFAGGSSSAGATPGTVSSNAGSSAPDVTPSAVGAAPVDSAAAAAASAAIAAAGSKPKPNVGSNGAWHPQAAAPGAKGTPGGGPAAATGAAPVVTAPAATPAKKNDCGCNGDLMCLMKCSTH
jgi:predicted Zn finger-like uncharacterized protein